MFRLSILEAISLLTLPADYLNKIALTLKNEKFLDIFSLGRLCGQDLLSFRPGSEVRVSSSLQHHRSVLL